MPPFRIRVKAPKAEATQLNRNATGPALTAALKQGAAEVAHLFRAHWIQKDAAEPNYFARERFGTRRTHFWRKISNSVGSVEVDTSGMSFKIPIKDKRLRQKVKGGPIVPKKARALTIPVHPDAYARSAAELERALGVKLFILRTALGDAFLAAKRELRKGRKSVIRYYLLKRGVFQQPWPGTMPERSEIRKAFRFGVNGILRQRHGR
jgi:hypothetical protein